MFERLNRNRVVPRLDLAAARDGSLLEIPFTSFQAEDGAEIELILGLSRPLRKFDLLRKDPPKLRLYQEGEQGEGGRSRRASLPELRRRGFHRDDAGLSCPQAAP